MKLFEITYTEGQDTEKQTALFRGNSWDHAESRFLEAMEQEGGNEGVEVWSVLPVKSPTFIPAPIV